MDKLRAMIKKSPLVLLVFIILFFFCFPKNALAVDFELPQRSFNMVVNEDGSAQITESVTWLLKGPFRYVSWQVDYPNPMVIDDFNYVVEDGPSLDPQIYYQQKTPEQIALQLWFTKMGSTNAVPVPEGGQIVKVSFHYHVRNILMQGKDFSQIFVKFVGSGTSVKTDRLEVLITLPKKFGDPQIYLHPLGLTVQDKLQSAGQYNLYNAAFRNVPANTYVEGRIVFPTLITSGSTYANRDLTLADVQNTEHSYVNTYLWTKTIALLYPALFVSVILLLYFLFGREKRIDYNAPYEREIPSTDPPEVVNAIVMQACGKPDSNGFSSALLDMVKKGCLGIGDGKSEGTILKIVHEDADRPELSNALRIIADEDGLIDTSKLSRLFKDKNRAIRFWEEFTRWEEETMHQATTKHFLDVYGNIVAKTVAVVGGLVLPTLLYFWGNNSAYPLLDAQTWLNCGLSFSAVVGIVVLLMKPTVFSHWTADGLLYIRKWQALRRYLTDFTLISKDPPQALTIWDDFLIFGTALGTAKKVVGNFKQLYPEPPSTPVASTLYVRPFLINDLNSIASSAAVAVSKGSGAASGFGSSGANIGGGAGGSSVGAG
jgi:uncharacterized membrane protein